MESKASEGFVIGFLAGAVIGGVIALLYAPKPGKKIRQLINDKATEVIDEVVDTVKEETSGVIDTVKEVTSESIRKGKAWVKEVNKMAVSKSVKDQVYDRSGGRCECTREHVAGVNAPHLGPKRCPTTFTRSGDQWEAHYIVAGGPDIASNCEALCLGCYKLTGTHGR